MINLSQNDKFQNSILKNKIDSHMFHHITFTIR